MIPKSTPKRALFSWLLTSLGAYGRLAVDYLLLIKTKEENVIFKRAVSVNSVLTWKAGTLPTELLPQLRLAL